jgi:hypothetical protein
MHKKKVIRAIIERHCYILYVYATPLSFQHRKKQQQEKEKIILCTMICRMEKKKKKIKGKKTNLN